MTTRNEHLARIAGLKILALCLIVGALVSAVLVAREIQSAPCTFGSGQMVRNANGHRVCVEVK